jgi:hypothetical protein
MIREGWGFWFRHTGWKVILPVVLGAGLLAVAVLS